MKCDICSVEESIPFRCRYCGGNFCSDHRLPPNHNCIYINHYLSEPARRREYIERVQGRSGSGPERAAAILKNAVVLRFSVTEIIHLSIATVLIMVVGLSIYNYRFSPEFIAIFISAFIVHELAHKFLAQFYRAWAEFRVIIFGAALTAMAALPFWPVKFIAPGAVMVSGNLSASRNGKVSWIGPLTNITMCAGFLGTFFLLVTLYGHAPRILLVGAQFNGIIGLFNLIPFMGLDGEKIFWWSKLRWIVTVAGAGLLYLVTDFAMMGPLSRLLLRF